MSVRRLARRGLPIAAVAVAAPLILSSATSASADSAPLTWTFDKYLADPAGVWHGKAVGPSGAEEPLVTKLTGLRESDAIWHVDFDWHVGSTYMAALHGTLNLKTGAVVMNGQVEGGGTRVAGYTRRGRRMDARVHEVKDHSVESLRRQLYESRELLDGWLPARLAGRTRRPLLVHPKPSALGLRPAIPPPPR